MNELLFDPATTGPEDQISPDGVVGTTCLINPKPDGAFLLSVENYNWFPVWMEEGQPLGKLVPVQMPLDAVTADKLSEVCTLQTPSKISDPGRVSELLLEQLDIEAGLSITEKEEVCQAITEFADVFALIPGELGHTEQVQYIVDTGDHPPIKQLPHRTPFALRKLTEEMIAKMLEQGIVKPSSSPWASPVVLVAKKDGWSRNWNW